MMIVVATAVRRGRGGGHARRGLLLVRAGGVGFLIQSAAAQPRAGRVLLAAGGHLRGEKDGSVRVRARRPCPLPVALHAHRGARPAVRQRSGAQPVGEGRGGAAAAAPNHRRGQAKGRRPQPHRHSAAARTRQEALAAGSHAGQYSAVQGGAPQRNKTENKNDNNTQATER